MFRNFCKITLRGLLRNKTFSLLNIAGLAIGMASAVLICLWIQDELRYDHFYPKQDRLYAMLTHHLADGKIGTGASTPEIMQPSVKREIPGVEDAVRIGWNSPSLFDYKDKQLRAQGTCADPGFLTMFDYPMIAGDPATALVDPHSIVLTQSMAQRLFGAEDPMGKIVKVDNSLTATVTGVMKDLPANSQIKLEWVNSYNYKSTKGYIDSDWTDVNNRMFVLLRPGASLDAVNKQMGGMIDHYSGGRARTSAFLYPMSRLHLYSEFANGKVIGGRITTVRIFGIIAFLILVIACINFMNLSTARSERRAKEVGVRKVIGAGQGSLILQFLGESMAISVIAGVLAFGLVQVSLPYFDTLTDKSLSLAYSTPGFWLSAVGFICLTGLLAGSYPAFFLSRFRPVSVLKGVFKKTQAQVTPRKVLVVIQFTVAIVLVVGTLVILRQVRHAQGRNTGYNQQNLVYVNIEGEIGKHYESIRNDLLASGSVTALSATMAPLTQTFSMGTSLSWPGMTPETHITFMRSATDGDIVRSAGLTLVQGRDIDIHRYPSDSTACLINEAALKATGLKDPIGQDIYDDPTHWHVVGVIKDFILNSPYEPIMPMIIKGPKYYLGVIHLKLNPNHSTSENLAAVEKVFKTYNPSYPFEYHFIDEEYAQNFASEKRTGSLAALFAGLTVLISCLGLFGLATYMAESRIKEIGIRKVLGASATHIALLLSGSFVRLVLLSILIATPISWYAMHQWLEGYTYRTTISGWLFVAAGGIAVLIAVVTVSFQALRAALSNPVKSLRTE